MAEYTITLTVREIEGGIHIRQRRDLGPAADPSLAHAVAAALDLAVACEVERLKACMAKNQSGFVHPPSPTRH